MLIPQIQKKTVGGVVLVGSGLGGGLLPEAKACHEYLIAIGSNIEPRTQFIDSALNEIANRAGQIIARSAFIESLPIGAADLPFLNGAITLASVLDPFALLDQLQKIEHELGRIRTQKWGNRTIDLDIILARSPEHKNLSLTSPELTIPHPEALNRDFVMITAISIAPDWLHPKLGMNLAAIWTIAEKNSKV